ncbi:MAG: asparagine--tRNA ligase [Rhodothermaceae bacterium]|nr:asparagine--tRNA ligase [Rhodothermaceae bacterium]MYG70358.1 asparagine--tRNA ligase [Rhodothermaceae bacterium]MYJ44682.1 asparagine--tRNA ligase [Rhodothermaceae bacterium]
MDVETTTIESLPKQIGQTATLRGWLQQKRGSKGLFFLVLRDGTGQVQCVVNQQNVDASSWENASVATQETSLVIKGEIQKDERQVGGVEVQVSSIDVIQIVSDYPITPKSHGVEFLMDRRHLWLRSRRPWAVMRIRNRIIMSIHNFFQERGFLQMDAPLLTKNAVEGTSTLFEIDYFGSSAYLTQSGQLHGEVMAMAFNKIYTFGPVFRAEKSKTRRHLTEFWMIEPEMAFYDLEMNMTLAEDFLVRIASDAVSDCEEELELLGRDLDALYRIQTPFPRLTYSEAVELIRSEKTRLLIEERQQELRGEKSDLENERAQNKEIYGRSKEWKKRRIDAREIEINTRLDQIEEELRNLPQWWQSAAEFEWGKDFGGSDETLLTWHFDRPIIVHRYPEAVKAFYMKRDPEDDRLALGMDVLAPEGFGEIIGGGQRADDLAFLEEQVRRHNLPQEAFEWYFDLRRYGSVPHSGFGLGLERTVAWVCGLEHIRETIPFPRTLGRLTP